VGEISIVTLEVSALADQREDAAVISLFGGREQCLAQYKSIL